MKKQYVVPVALGSAFFAVPYLMLNISVLPSILSAVIAYGAGWLLVKEKKTSNSLNEDNKETLKKAKILVAELSSISKQVEDEKLIVNINEITQISYKILDTLEKKPAKFMQANNFLNYYLPVTIKILKRYDEIENQKLNTEQTNKFMRSIEDMIEKIKTAFTTQLSNMYQNDIIDTDAEIRVFESLLKADGFLLDDDFKKQ